MVTSLMNFPILHWATGVTVCVGEIGVLVGGTGVVVVIGVEDGRQILGKIHKALLFVAVLLFLT
jgi:hypothetical protein